MIAKITKMDDSTRTVAMAIFGWTTIKQAEHYTKKANRKRLAGDAMHLLVAAGSSTEP